MKKKLLFHLTNEQKALLDEGKEIRIFKNANNRYTIKIINEETIIA